MVLVPKALSLSLSAASVAWRLAARFAKRLDAMRLERTSEESHALRGALLTKVDAPARKSAWHGRELWHLCKELGRPRQKMVAMAHGVAGTVLLLAVPVTALTLCGAVWMQPALAKARIVLTEPPQPPGQQHRAPPWVYNDSLPLLTNLVHACGWRVAATGTSGSSSGKSSSSSIATQHSAVHSPARSPAHVPPTQPARTARAPKNASTVMARNAISGAAADPRAAPKATITAAASPRAAPGAANRNVSSANHTSAVQRHRRHGRRMSAADSDGPVIDDARPMGQCECSFVDIGLNDGNTLEAWWRDQSALAALPSAQARRLQACTADLSARSHCYWGMEANPRWTVALRALEARMRAKGHRVQLLTETALSTHDGEATFYVERNLKSSPGLDASLEAERGVHYKDRSGWHWALNSTLRESSAFVPVRVRTVAAGPFLERLVSTSSFVAIKIDIEGSEFRVLRHVLLTQPGVLCRLNVLAVEWHGTLLQHHVPANLTQAFQWLLAGCNVGHVSWH